MFWKEEIQGFFPKKMLRSQNQEMEKKLGNGKKSKKYIKKHFNFLLVQISKTKVPRAVIVIFSYYILKILFSSDDISSEKKIHGMRITFTNKGIPFPFYISIGKSNSIRTTCMCEFVCLF